MLKPSRLTGGGGGQGFSAFGGAIEAGRIRALGVLTGVVCHRGREREGEELNKYISSEAAEGKKVNTGANKMTN
jgi:hypothetical protein